MPFDIRLTISGLCMYVPDGDVMHVLMPAAHEHGGHGHVPHHALLMYDRKYHAAGELPEGEGPCVMFPLDRCAVAMRAHGTSGGSPKVGALVPALDQSVNFETVPRACLSHPLDNRLHARLELRGAGPAAGYTGLGLSSNEKFCLAPVGRSCGDPNARPPQHMAEHVHWDLGSCEGDDIALDAVLIAAQDTDPLPLPAALRLKPHGSLVEIRVAYVIQSVIGPMCAGNPSPMDPAAISHFPMYYGLSSSGAGTPYTVAAAVGAPLMHPSSACVPTQARFGAS